MNHRETDKSHLLGWLLACAVCAVFLFFLFKIGLTDALCTPGDKDCFRQWVGAASSIIGGLIAGGFAYLTVAAIRQQIDETNINHAETMRLATQNEIVMARRAAVIIDEVTGAKKLLSERIAEGPFPTLHDEVIFYGVYLRYLMDKLDNPELPAIDRRFNQTIFHLKSLTDYVNSAQWMVNSINSAVLENPSVASYAIQSMLPQIRSIEAKLRPIDVFCEGCKVGAEQFLRDSADLHRATSRHSPTAR